MIQQFLTQSEIRWIIKYIICLMKLSRVNLLIGTGKEFDVIANVHERRKIQSELKDETI